MQITSIISPFDIASHSLFPCILMHNYEVDLVDLNIQKWESLGH